MWSKNKASEQNGQGIIEYVVALVIIIVVVVVVVAAVVGVFNIVSNAIDASGGLANVLGDYEFNLRDAIVQECIKSEHYTRDECIRLAGAGENAKGSNDGQ